MHYTQHLLYKPQCMFLQQPHQLNGFTHWSWILDLNLGFLCRGSISARFILPSIAQHNKDNIDTIHNIYRRTKAPCYKSATMKPRNLQWNLPELASCRPRRVVKNGSGQLHVPSGVVSMHVYHTYTNPVKRIKMVFCKHQTNCPWALHLIWWSASFELSLTSSATPNVLTGTWCC